MIEFKSITENEYVIAFEVGDETYIYDRIKRRIDCVDDESVINTFGEEDRYCNKLVNEIFRYVDEGRRYLYKKEKQMQLSSELEEYVIKKTREMRAMAIDTMILNLDYVQIVITDVEDCFDIVHEDKTKQPFIKRDCYSFREDDNALVYEYSEQY